ncbi:L,D-transpeptidase [Patescibacteria group bacterium]
MKKTALLIATITIFSLITTSAFASIPRKIMRTSVVDSDDSQEEIIIVAADDQNVEPVAQDFEEETEEDLCDYEIPIEDIFDAQTIQVRRKLRVEPNEVFRVKVFVKNTGNVPWFSEKSSCQGQRIFLGSDRERDRDSEMYISDLKIDDEINGWLKGNRIDMDQLRTDPGEIASFTFWSRASSNPDIIKEYFTPVIETIAWLDNAGFNFEMMIGDVGEDMNTIRKRLLFVNESGSVMDIDLNGEKLLLVDISSQTVTLFLDGYEIEQFPVSTGKSATPTPYGETSIMLKQQVRVGSAPPHYVMPKFQMFRAGGYGLHALPSLANDGGVFWTEARNHIGIPVSHGCIRLLPEDANYLFDFTDIGTRVVVQP